MGDQYTVFVEPISHELETQALQGEYGGIGVSINKNAAGEIGGPHIARGDVGSQQRIEENICLIEMRRVNRDRQTIERDQSAFNRSHESDVGVGASLTRAVARLQSVSGPGDGETNIAIGERVDIFSDRLAVFWLALGRSDELAHSSLRITIGRFTTEADIDYAVETIRHNVAKLRDLSPLWDMYKEGIDLSTIQWAAH